MRSRLSLDRRTFLTAAGLGGASLFLPSTRARAADAPPKRLVIFYTVHGNVYNTWKMRPPGTSDTDFNVALPDDVGQWSEILKPFHPLRAKTTVVDGISMCTALADIDGINEHYIGTANSLTGSLLTRTGTDEFSVTGSTPSIDQIIADKIKVSGRFTSIEGGMPGTATRGAIYRAASVQVPYESDPRAIFNRLFPTSGTASTGDAQKLLSSRASVLDLVRQEYTSMAGKVGAADRAKLELHRDLVRDMETRLQALSAVQCENPSTPVLTGDYDTAPFYKSRTDALARITAAALSCDLTRVVSLQMGQLPNAIFGAPPGDVHEAYAHHSERDPTAIEMMTAYGKKNADHIVELATLLDAIPEGNGTLLDNTTIVWLSELATGTHKYNIYPAVVVGGAGGAIRTGRYLRYKPATPNPTRHPTWEGTEPLVGRPHNHLLVSLARAFGVDTNVVGASSLTTQAGVRLDLTGTLPGFLT